jgi:2-C-methyl-D-erythritol 2,4-cyclodiphosphate synthase
MRVGIGYDIHRLEPGRPLMLGGVPVAHSAGLVGHSDADVAVHALMDGILGAAGLGDIGEHFPPGDERFRAISSLTLLAQVSELVRCAGYTVVNADLVIVAERPKIGPYATSMREAIGGALGVDPSRISVKATTNERVGPEGREEAISAQAVVLLEERA